MREEEEWDAPTFIDKDKLQATAEKLKSGEFTCNIQNPEECENCSG